MRYRDLTGWDSALSAAKELWRDVPDTAWEQLGDSPAREGQTFLHGANDLFSAVQTLGIYVVRPKGRS